MPNSGNPAQRLYEIVVKSEKVFREAKQSHKSTISWDIWANIFDLESVASREEQLELISRVNQGRKLVDEVELLLFKNEEYRPRKIFTSFSKT